MSQQAAWAKERKNCFLIIFKDFFLSSTSLQHIFVCCFFFHHRWCHKIIENGKIKTLNVLKEEYVLCSDGGEHAKANVNSSLFDELSTSQANDTPSETMMEKIENFLSLTWYIIFYSIFILYEKKCERKKKARDIGKEASILWDDMNIARRRFHGLHDFILWHTMTKKIHRRQELKELHSHQKTQRDQLKRCVKSHFKVQTLLPSKSVESQKFSQVD